MKYINFLTCIFTTGVCIYIVFQCIYKKKSSLTDIIWRDNSRLLKFLFCVVWFSAIAIRLYHFGLIPQGFSQDEAMAAYDARSLEMYGTDHYGNSFPVQMIAWGASQQSPILPYLMAVCIRLFGYSIPIVRLPILMVSLMGMLFFGLLVKDIWGKQAELVAYAVCSVNPWHFVQSRYALDCNMFPHILIMGIYLLEHGIFRKNTKYLYAGVAVLALSHYGYAVSIYAVPILLFIYSIYLYKNRMITSKQLIISVLIYFAIAWPFLLTMILNAVGIQKNISISFFTIPAFPQTDRRSDMIFWADNIPLQLAKNLYALFCVVFLQYETVPWDSVEHYGTMFYCMVPVLSLGLFTFFRTFKESKNKDRKAQYMLIIFCMLMILCEGLIINVGGIIRRFNICYYFEMLMVVIGLITIWRERKKIFISVAMVYVLMGMLLIFSYNSSYGEEFLSPSASSKYILEAANQMRKYKCETYYITPSTLYSDAKSVTEIWILFAFDIDSHYYRGISDKSYTMKYPNIYKDQFQYIEANQLTDINYLNSCVYLINASDYELFSADEYNSYQYGSYYVEVPRWMKEE